MDCKNLKEVVLNREDILLGTGAFKDTLWLSELPIDAGYKYFSNILMGYEGNEKKVIVRDGTKSIAGGVFNDFSELEEVILPDSLTVIGGSNFSYCQKLSYIDIPKNVELMGKNVFADCDSLEKIVLPNKIKSVQPYSFYQCKNLKEVVLGSDLENIWDNSFAECENLSSINLTDKTKYIGEKAFEGCKKLIDIGDSSGVSFVGYKALNDTPWYNSQKEVDGCKYVGKVLVECLDKTKTTIQLKEGTTMIAEASLEGTRINNLDFLQGIKIIGDRAFENCNNLVFANIPVGVEYLGNNIFYSCQNLREIYLPESVNFVSTEVFGRGISDHYKNISLPSHLNGKFVYHGKAKIRFY